MEQEIETAPAVEVKGSFPEAILTPEQWAQVKEACVAGLSYQEAATIFKTSYNAIKQRAWREEWPTPLKLENLRKAKTVTELLPEGQVSEKRPETALEALSTSFEGYRSRTLLQLAKAAENGIKRMVEADLPIENWQDAKSAADIAMKLHNVGQDSVQVNIAQAFAGMDEGPVVETEVVNGDDERDNADTSKCYFIDDE